MKRVDVGVSPEFTSVFICLNNETYGKNNLIYEKAKI